MAFVKTGAGKLKGKASDKKVKEAKKKESNKKDSGKEVKEKTTSKKSDDENKKGLGRPGILDKVIPTVNKPVAPPKPTYPPVAEPVIQPQQQSVAAQKPVEKSDGEPVR